VGEVVQEQNVASLEEYLAAPRLGRGTRLTRDQKKIWPVFQEYRAQLNQVGKKEYVDLIRDARQLIENKKLKLPYRAVIVDEAQDFSVEAFRLIRLLVPPEDIPSQSRAGQMQSRHPGSRTQAANQLQDDGRDSEVRCSTAGGTSRR
jgi:superfamily I DNA/RNA helicase